MSISPSVALWINIVLAIANAITTGGLSFAGIISPSTAAQIVAIAGTVQVILSTIMHALSSAQAGPLATPPANPPAQK